MSVVTRLLAKLGLKRARFVLARYYYYGVHEVGVLDRETGKAAPFGNIANARRHLAALRAGKSTRSYVWDHPTAVTDLRAVRK